MLCALEWTNGIHQAQAYAVIKPWKARDYSQLLRPFARTIMSYGEKSCLLLKASSKQSTGPAVTPNNKLDKGTPSGENRLWLPFETFFFLYPGPAVWTGGERKPPSANLHSKRSSVPWGNVVLPFSLNTSASPPPRSTSLSLDLGSCGLLDVSRVTCTYRRPCPRYIQISSLRFAPQRFNLCRNYTSKRAGTKARVKRPR